MKVKAEIRFKDNAAGVLRVAGETWECTQARFDEINKVLPGAVTKVATPRKKAEKKED